MSALSPLEGAGNRRRKIFDLLLSQAIPLAASSLMTLATAVILGTSGRGELALILGGAGLLGAAGFLSLHVGIVRAHRDGDPTATRTGWLLAGAISLAVVVVGILLHTAAPTLQVGLFNRTTSLLITIGAAILLLNLVVLRTRQGLGDSRVFRNSWFIQSVVFPLLGIPTALLTHSSTWVAVCWFVALSLSTLHAIRAGSQSPVPPRRGRTGPKRLIATSLPAHVGTVGQQLLFRGDVVVLGFLVSASSVGVYSIAMPIAGLIWVFSEALSLLAFDSGTRHQSAEARNARRRKLVQANFVMGGIGAVVIGVGSWLLIPSLLPQYSDAVLLILILLPGVLVQGWARIGLASIVTSGAVGAPIIIGGISAILSLIYIPFVALYGVLGAALASTLIYTLQTLVVVVVTRHISISRGNGDQTNE